MRRPRLGRGRVQRLRGRPPRPLVQGQVVHDEAQQTPLHGVRVELALSSRGREDFLGRATTGHDGRFVVEVRLPPTARGGRVLAKVVVARPRLTPEEPDEVLWRVIGRARSPRLDDLGPVDLGTLRVPHWEVTDSRPPLWRPRQDPPPPGPPPAERAVFDARRRKALATLLLQPWLDAEGGPLDAPRVAVEEAFDAREAPSLATCLEHLPVPSWEPIPEGDRWRWTPPAGLGWPALEAEVSRGPSGWVLETSSLGSGLQAEATLRRRLALEAWVVGPAGGLLAAQEVALAAARHLRTSPLAALLQPHLRDAPWLGAALAHQLFGPSRVASRVVDGGPEALWRALSQGVSRRRHALTADGGRPGALGREARRVLHEVVRDHVAAFLSQHEQGIGSTWREVRRMASDLSSWRIRDEPARLGAGGDGWHRVARGTRDDGEVRAVLAELLVEVITDVLFDASWWRAHLVPLLAARGMALRSGEVSAEDEAHRFRLAATLGDRSVAGVERDALGEVPEGLLRALSRHRDALSEVGLPPAAIAHRFGP